ncbi:MAG: MFS transporter, partial [Gammaproteobacteria bacterium]
ASAMLAFGGLWGVPWLTNVHGYTTTEAAAVTSMLFVGWAIFSPLCGWASDRMGRRNIILLAGSTTALAALTSLIFLTPVNTALLMMLIFVIGASGSAMTVCFGSVKELNDANYSSTSLGLMNMCIVGSGAVMQPLVGLLLDLNWSGEMLAGARVYSASNYTLAFSSLLVTNLMALTAAFFLRETHCRQVA